MNDYQRYRLEIERYEKKFASWERRGEKIIDRYRDERNERTTTAKMNILWSNVQTAMRKQSWARLLQKVYEVDPFVCPKCQGTMSVVAIIEDPKELAKIINWAKQQEREQPVAVCARSPPELALV